MLMDCLEMFQKLTRCISKVASIQVIILLVLHFESLRSFHLTNPYESDDTGVSSRSKRSPSTTGYPAIGPIESGHGTFEDNGVNNSGVYVDNQTIVNLGKPENVTKETRNDTEKFDDVTKVKRIDTIENRDDTEKFENVTKVKRIDTRESRDDTEKFEDVTKLKRIDTKESRDDTEKFEDVTKVKRIDTKESRDDTEKFEDLTKVKRVDTRNLEDDTRNFEDDTKGHVVKSRGYKPRTIEHDEKEGDRFKSKTEDDKTLEVIIGRNLKDNWDDTEIVKDDTEKVWGDTEKFADDTERVWGDREKTVQVIIGRNLKDNWDNTGKVTDNTNRISGDTEMSEDDTKNQKDDSGVNIRINIKVHVSHTKSNKNYTSNVFDTKNFEDDTKGHVVKSRGYTPRTIEHDEKEGDRFNSKTEDDKTLEVIIGRNLKDNWDDTEIVKDDTEKVLGDTEKFADDTERVWGDREKTVQVIIGRNLKDNWDDTEKVTDNTNRISGDTEMSEDDTKNQKDDSGVNIRINIKVHVSHTKSNKNYTSNVYDTENFLRDSAFVG